MGSLSIWHLLILGAVVLLLFGGKGKISDIMGDFAKGIKSFKKGLADDDAPAAPTASLDHRQAVEANPVSQSQKIN
jgi:sec-independent protein translocase protein TatA